MLEWLRHWRYGKQYGYERYFRNQDLRIVGKPGIILADLGMPESFDAGFYTCFMEHVFHYSLPGFVQRIILKDRGIALIDPDNPLAREPFTPVSLVDQHGSFTNREGIPYVQCKVDWRPPGMKRNPNDHGYFLYTGDGKGGSPDICQKTAAKVAGWYFGKLLPGAKVAWESQCRSVFREAAGIIRAEYPGALITHARYSSEVSLRGAVEELLAAGCETIIYQSFCNPVYSDFEDYAYAMPAVYAYVKGRAKVIFADQLGNQPAMRKAFTEILNDQLGQIPDSESVMVILSRHGHPFRRETQDKRAPLYRIPLEKEMREVILHWGGQASLVWSDDEYADEYWDSRGTKTSTLSVYRLAIEEGYNYAVEIPVEFIAENTDLMIFHAMKKFRAFSTYNPGDPVHYPDWEKPLVRQFHERKTTGIYAGCPVGPYRKYVAQAAADSILSLLAGECGKNNQV